MVPSNGGPPICRPRSVLWLRWWRRTRGSPSPGGSGRSEAATELAAAGGLKDFSAMVSPRTAGAARLPAFLDRVVALQDVVHLVVELLRDKVGLSRIPRLLNQQHLSSTEICP